MSRSAHASSFSGRAVVYGHRVGTGWGILGGYTGWVIRGPPSTLESGAHDSEAGPGSPSMGLEWVVMGAAPARLQEPTLRARSVPVPGPSLVPGPSPPPGQ